MRVRTARKGPNAGKQFLGCSRYPECEGTRSLDGASGGESSGEAGEAPEPASSSSALQRPVTWRDGTLSRPGWTCRYTALGGSLRVASPGADRAPGLGQSWIAISDQESGEVRPGPTPFTRVVRKILQRGTTPPIHPESEQALIDQLGWRDRVMPSPLPGELGFDSQAPLPVPEWTDVALGASTDFRASPSLEFDSDEEERFYHGWAPENLGSSAARWIVPQAPLDTLLRAHEEDTGGRRRLDFLAVAPWGDPFAIEIDGTQHERAQGVDDDRDEQLREIGIPVVRIPAEELRSGSGPNLRSVRTLWSPQPGPSSPDREKALVAPVQLHRLALAITEAVEEGFLSGDHWMVRVEDDVGGTTELFPPYLDLFVALDTIWQSDIMPERVVLGDVESWKVYERRQSGYDRIAEARGSTESDEVDVHIRLQARRTAQDALPSRESAGPPQIVARSASLPVRLSSAEPVGPTRHLPEVPAGEAGDGALREVLRGVFAKKEFREGQLQAIRQVMSGHDCAVLLPTGGGKSLVYQLAGVCMPGVTVVVDPIVSLMEDQIEALRDYGIDRALSITAYQVRQGRRDLLLESVETGEALFVFVAPERFQKQGFRGAVRAAAEISPVNLAVIDEAHCVSEWGHDFRTSYLNLGRILRSVARDSRGEPPPLLALTGTASRAIMNDMLVELDIDPAIPGTIVKPETFDRQELQFSVRLVEPDEALPTLRGILRSLPPQFREDETNFFRPRGRDTRSGIVFCPHVNGDYGIVRVAESLTSAIGTQVAMYSGKPPRGIPPKAWERRKRENAEAFRGNDAPLLVSTKAFGMGIDKANIRYVAHYGMPGSIEAYYQEAGRAGRDRERAECVLVLIEFERERAERLLSETASLAEMREQREDVPRSESDDITRQLYFHLNSFPGIDEEVATLETVLDDLGEIGRRRREEIPFESDDEDREPRERALHRLVILGVLRDYLMDWGGRKFDARLESADPDEVVDSALRYIRRSQPGRVRSERERLERYRSTDLRSAVLGTAEELVRFIYETIEKSRRRSLREMWLAAREAATDSDADLRQRILEYLTEGELVPRLEELVERDEFAFDDWISLYEDIANAEEARELRGSTGRLLGSFPDHPGLLAARAFSEAEMPNGDLREFYSNFDDALRVSRDKYSSTREDLHSFARWALERCRELGAEDVLAGTVALLEKHGIATEAVREIENQALAGERASPALSVLGLARSLEELNGLFDELTSTIDKDPHV